MGVTARPRVTVVGLGPGGPDLLTAETAAILASGRPTFLRTARHPAASAAVGAATFDHHYERLESIDAVYAAIVEDVVAAAAVHGHVVYAVPGSPAVAERTVELLRAEPRIDADVLAALSCVDLAWVRLGVDPLSDGARIVDGHRFMTEAAGQRGPLLVLQCDRPDVLSEIKLSADPDREPDAVVVLHRLGLPDESVQTVAWTDVDRVAPDHLTSIWIPAGEPFVGRELVAFAELVRTLRDRCPWDAEQTHQSLRRYLLEEAYEVLDAIDRLDESGYEGLEEELGDLLFQVYFHATLAAEEGQFTLADVARGIHDKLVRRHPHVFGGEPRDWDEIKRSENKPAVTLDALPALARAEKAQRRAAKVGFDWSGVEGAWPKVLEEIDEVRAASPDEIAGEMGDLLFACVNVARHLRVDPESALRGATAKFERRFAEVSRRAAARGLPFDLPTLDALWDEVKGDGGAVAGP
ncbi:MAG: nucleoside triphosphate pyrophosphohydrolase [Acidimicrobiales bacterium]